MTTADPAHELALARAAAAGDRRAAEELLGAVYPQVHAICRRICAHDSDGEDAAQEALISIARSLPAFDGRSAVRTWVYRISTNAALDELRRRKRRPEPVDAFDGVDAGLGLAAGGSSDRAPGTGRDRSQRPSMEAGIVDRIDIDRALAELPPDFRAAVVLRDLIGMEYSDIAETLGVPVGTVRSRIARGRLQLRDLLELGNQTPSDDVQPEEP